MPIYEYHCKDCGKDFEALQRISAEPLTECKYCSGHIEKLVSNSSFKFKGGGWYITDYKNKTKKTSDTTKNLKTNNKTIQNKTKINTDKNAETKEVNEHKKVS